MFDKKQLNENKKTLMLIGASGSGKTVSLMELIQKYGNRVGYIDADGQNELPFKGRKGLAYHAIPKDPLELKKLVKEIEDNDEIEVGVIDTISHWLRALEQKYVISSEDSRGAWGKVYQSELYGLIDFISRRSSKTWIVMSHSQEGPIINDIQRQVGFVKGSTKAVGLESFFQYVFWIFEIEAPDTERGIENKILTRKTKETLNLSVKTPIGFSESIYVDGNILKLLEKMDEYAESWE